MRRAQGFTLIEVLIALVILSIAFAAMIHSVNQQVRNLQYLNDKTTSLWVASNALAEAQLGLVGADDTIGQETQLHQTWYWQLKIESTQNDTIERLRVDVKATSDGPTISELTGFRQRETN